MASFTKLVRICLIIFVSTAMVGALLESERYPNLLTSFMLSWMFYRQFKRVMGAPILASLEVLIAWHSDFGMNRTIDKFIAMMLW